MEKLEQINKNSNRLLKLVNNLIDITKFELGSYELKLENFVKIKDDQVRVVVIKENQDAKLATDIMNLVQSNFDSKMYISIKFQK